MPPRLLIINCSSPYFFYIPMGTFGLCDYLGQRGLAARIFNPALYPAGEGQVQLFTALTAFQPTHVGFVLHWQETAHGLLTALAAVTAWNPEVVTFCGGFTASYFAEDLLATAPNLDYVVVGDPEEPVAQLLQEYPPAEIANLVRRGQHGAIVCNENRWLMDQPLLDSLSFAGLLFLIDADRYLEKINTKLGFPLFLGRGCVFDCEYCGGSRHAFRLHSGRQKPVTRSVAAILADLHVLKGRTSLLYLCYENDPGFIMDLFRAIAEDQELKGYFTLHYGAWHLLDQQFLELYRAAFNCTALPPLFEFSPEVFSDARRLEIKRGATYTVAQLRQNIEEIGREFNGQVRIEVFFSRYHPALTTEMLAQEIRDIFLLKHQMFVQGSPLVHICFDHLSTDVGSRYWQKHVPEHQFFTTLLHLKQSVDEGTLYPFPVDNLCLFIPEHLPHDFRMRMEALLLVLEQLERYCHELFHIFFACLGDRWLDDLEAVLTPALEGEAVSTFFAAPPLEAVLTALDRRLTDDPISSATLPFLTDLVRFTRNKFTHASRPPSPCQRPSHDRCLVLNAKSVSIHAHDYLNLMPLLQRLHQRDTVPLAYQRTVCLFLDSGIVTLSHAFYRTTFKYFEQPHTLAEYQASLTRKQGFDRQQHDQLLNQLLTEGLLLPVSSF